VIRDIPYLFGPLGYAAPIDCVPSGQVTAARASSDFNSVYGFRNVQRGGYAPREWVVTLTPWSTPGVASLLQAAAQGLLGDVWLWDLAGMRTNMLPPASTAGVSGTAIAVGSLPPLRPVTAGQVTKVPLRSGRNYSLTGYTTAASGTVLGTTKLGAASAVNFTAPAGSGSRQFTVALAPGSDLVLTLTVSSAVVTGLRLVEAVTGTTFADSLPWVAGQASPCKVSVVDPDAELHGWSSSGAPLADYTVTLREVGTPGVV